MDYGLMIILKKVDFYFIILVQENLLGK